MKNDVVPALVNKIGRDRHRMCQQKCRREIDRWRGAEEPDDAETVAENRIGHRGAVVAPTLSLFNKKGFFAHHLPAS